MLQGLCGSDDATGRWSRGRCQAPQRDPGIEGAPKPPWATCQRLLLLQQGGRTHTRIEADRVDLLPVINDHKRKGERA